VRTEEARLWKKSDHANKIVAEESVQGQVVSLPKVWRTRSTEGGGRTVLIQRYF
jgi:hypothetical protein